MDGLGGDLRAQDVDREGVGPAVVVAVGGRVGPQHRRVVDQHVGGAEVGDGGVDGGPEAGRVAGVGGVAAGGLLGRVELRRVAVQSGGVAGQQGDRVAGVGEGARQRRAEAGPDADNHGSS